MIIIQIVESPYNSPATVKACGRFDESLKAYEDWDYWLRCALNGFSFRCLDVLDTNALVRYHFQSLSKDPLLMYDNLLAFRNKLARSLNDAELDRLNTMNMERARLLRTIDPLIPAVPGPDGGRRPHQPAFPW